MTRPYVESWFKASQEHWAHSSHTYYQSVGNEKKQRNKEMNHNTPWPKYAMTIVQTIFVQLESKGLKKIKIKAKNFFK